VHRSATYIHTYIQDLYDLTRLKSLYKINDTDSTVLIKKKVWLQFSDELNCTIQY